MKRWLIALVASLCFLAPNTWAQLPPSEIGIVVMHGKGGDPTKLVAGLAKWLSGRGYKVASCNWLRGRSSTGGWSPLSATCVSAE